MKNFKLLPLFLIATLSFILVGCSSNANTTTTDKTKENTTTTTDNTQTGTTTTDNKTETNTTNTSTSDFIANESIESLTKIVDEAVAKADAATATGTTSNDHTKFFELKKELNAVEYKLDSYEDHIEEQYRQNAISYEEYRKMEQELDKLEDKLDAVEDKLETIFGIND